MNIYDNKHSMTHSNAVLYFAKLKFCFSVNIKLQFSNVTSVSRLAVVKESKMS